MATTPQPPTTTTRRSDQETLRTNLHDRLSRLRTSQMEARRRYEERLRQQQQFQIQPGQTVLQFGPPFSLASSTQRPMAAGNGLFL